MMMRIVSFFGFIFCFLKLLNNLASSKPNQYFRESPYDHEVTRKVKRYASEIDKFRYFSL
jgi:hypothetical protein